MIRVLCLALFSLTAFAGVEKAGFRVTGTCRARDGALLSGLSLSLLDPTSGAVLATCKSGEAGAFVLAPGTKALSAREHAFGPVRVRAEGNGYSPREVGVRAGAIGVELRLPSAFQRRGQVVDPEGTPIVGASVIATAINPRGNYRRAVKSDHGGKFLIPDLASDVQQLFVERQGFYSSGVSLREAGDVTVRLRPLPMKEVRGRVLDAQRQPVLDATVYGGFGNRAQTDVTGAFTIRVLTRGVSMGASGFRSAVSSLVVTKPGFWNSHVSLDGEAPLEVVIQPAPPLRVKLVTATGKPIRHALAHLKPGKSAAPGVRIQWWPTLTRSDSEGRILFSTRIRGPVALAVIRSGKLTQEIELPKSTDGVELTIRLPTVALVSGRVLRAGRAVCGARVEAAGRVDLVSAAGIAVSNARLSGLSSLAHTFSDADGRFVLEFPNGARAVHASADGARSRAALVESPPRSKTTPLGDLNLASDLGLVGVVVDDAGTRLTFGTIRCVSGADSQAKSEATVAASGRFELRQSAARAHRIRFSAIGYASTEVVAWPGDPIRIETARLRGTAQLKIVVDAELQESAATIRIAHTRFPEIKRVLEAKRGSLVVRAEELPFGTYAVAVTAVDYFVGRARVGLSSDSEGAECTSRLERGCGLRFSGTASASVRVVPLAAARVAARELRLGRDGRGQIAGLQPGRYLVVARHKGRLTRARVVELAKDQPQRDFDANLQESPGLVVRIQDENGNPVAGVRVRQRSEQGVSVVSQTVSDERGVLTFEELFEGPISLSAGHGDQDGTATAIGAPGNQIKVTIQIAEQESVIDVGPDADEG